MDLHDLVDLLQYLTAAGSGFVAAWFFVIATQTPIVDRRCLRVWIGLTMAAIAVENAVDAAIAWDNWWPHIVALSAKTLAILSCCAAIVRLYRAENHAGE